VSARAARWLMAAPPPLGGGLIETTRRPRPPPENLDQVFGAGLSSGRLPSYARNYNNAAREARNRARDQPRHAPVAGKVGGRIRTHRERVERRVRPCRRGLALRTDRASFGLSGAKNLVRRNGLTSRSTGCWHMSRYVRHRAGTGRRARSPATRRRASASAGMSGQRFVKSTSVMVAR